MKLIRMSAMFGCLDGQTLEFQDGLNLIYAPNGAGKSTWCAFLLVMLYGLDTRTRDKKGAMAEKNRYRPWNGKPMEGLLECEHQGERLILHRSSRGGVPMGECTLLYARTGLPVSGVTGDTVGEFLTGVGREVFERSVFLRQTGLSVNQSRELELRISSLVSSGEEGVSWSQVDARLREWQRKRKYHKNGQIPQLEEEESALREKLSQLAEIRQEVVSIQEELADLHNQKQNLDEEYAALTKEAKESAATRRAEAAADLDAAELQVQTLEARAPVSDDVGNFDSLIDELASDMTRRGQWFRWLTLGGLAICAAIALIALITKNIPPLILFAIVALVGIFSIAGNAIRLHKDAEDISEIDDLQKEQQEARETIQAQQNELYQARERLTQAQRLFDILNGQGGMVVPQLPQVLSNTKAISMAETQLALRLGEQNALGDPTLLEATLEELREQRLALEDDYEALELAISVLQEADQELQARFSPALNTRTSTYFSQLTDGAYEHVSLNRAFEAYAKTPDSLTPHSAAFLSQGTLDQLYLAVRLAVADLILPGEGVCPIILDDALTSFDDTRLKYALDCLWELSKTRQILLFTCHHREEYVLAQYPDVSQQTI